MATSKTPLSPAAARKPAARNHPLSVDDLWAFERIGALSLAPDGAHAVCSVTRSSMADNSSSSSLWLLPTAGRKAAPRRLTACGDKDGQPQWSPRSDRIAFVARREQQGSKDASAQLYLIAPDGGEAQRVSQFGPGVDSFKWMPDGKRILFAAWVWPELKGAAAQTQRHKSFTERKESGYATSEAYYRHWDHNVPQGRVLHLLLLDLGSGRITDLFEGTSHELPRDAAGTSAYDVSPDGARIAFVHAAEQPVRPGARYALSEMALPSRRVRCLVDEAGWDFDAPSYRPDGRAIAMTAAQIGHRHTALKQLALLDLDGKPAKSGQARWCVLSDAAWDFHAEAPLRWAEAGQALLFTAEQRGRCPLWRHDMSSGITAPAAVDGGWIQAFDVVAGLIVTASDSALHPVRVHAHRAGGQALRLERFNDALLAKRQLGEVSEVSVKGALGEPVQMWLTFPPGFDARKKHPVMHVIHGGPFAAAGDTFGYRWNPHVLAARGHVVAQVNYHGSSGFGFAWRDSIMGRQGELETQDIEAATNWLIQQPWADRSRISATGGSYGGFLVAWMNGHVKPGRYRSYVCHAGVFDRIATFSADSYMDRPRDLHARYWEDMDRVLAQSPHSAAAQMQTPTLVIHGALDYRVPDCNGLAYYNTLKARGIDARLLWFPDENHWVLKPRNAKLWYQEFLDWVEAHDRPAKPTQTARVRDSRKQRTR